MSSINLHQLRKVVTEEKIVETLKRGIIRSLGPVVNYSPRLEDMVSEANDRIEVLERTGRSPNFSIKPSILLKFSNHPSSEVRTFIARSLPSTMLERFMYDSSPQVRHAVAKRISLTKLKEMSHYYKNDDELHEIKKMRTLEADAIQVPAKDKLQSGLPLSDEWYKTLADKAVNDYGTNLEGRWEESYVDSICNAAKATSRVELDDKKLYSAVKEKIKNDEEKAQAKEDMRSLAKMIKKENSSERALFSQISEILSSKTSSLDRINLCNSFFSIKKSILPPEIKRLRIKENRLSNCLIPIRGKIPEGYDFSYDMEVALDLYQESWNRLQAMSGEPVKIKWAHDPSSSKRVIFTWEIK